MLCQICKAFIFHYSSLHDKVAFLGVNFEFILLVKNRPCLFQIAWWIFSTVCKYNFLSFEEIQCTSNLGFGLIFEKCMVNANICWCIHFVTFSVVWKRLPKQDNTRACSNDSHTMEEWLIDWNIVLASTPSESEMIFLTYWGCMCYFVTQQGANVQITVLSCFMIFRKHCNKLYFNLFRNFVLNVFKLQ